MALPILETPKFQTTLPSDGQKITYRPFTVKEQKNLMIAQQGSDEGNVLKVLNDCLCACVDEEINLYTRPLVDFEWVFLQVRSKSVGEMVELTGKCRESGASYDFDVDITKAQHGDFPDAKVQVTDDLVIEFRPTTLKDTKDAESEPEKVLGRCAKAVHYKGESFTEFTEEEFMRFIEPLTLDQYSKIDDYFAAQPSLVLEADGKCLKCGHVNKAKIRGVFNFFQ